MRGQTLPLVILVFAAAVAIFFAVQTNVEISPHDQTPEALAQAMHKHPPAGAAIGTSAVIGFTSGCDIVLDTCSQVSGPFTHSLPFVCRPPGCTTCCNGAGFCPPANTCPLVDGCHDSSSFLATFDDDSHHCCTGNQRPCDDALELAHLKAIFPAAPPLGIPADAVCRFFSSPVLLTSLGDFGPGCTFFCGDGFTYPAGVDGSLGNSDDEECDDGNVASGDGCSSTCKSEVPVVPSSGPFISIVKTPFPIFVGPLKHIVWVISLNVTGGGTSNTSNATNVTLNDTLSLNQTFINSSPSSVNGTNITVGNLSNGTIFLVNVTSQLNCTTNLTNTTLLWIITEDSQVTIFNTVALGWLTPDDDFSFNTTTVNTSTNCFIAGIKDDFPDPLNLSNSTVLNYTITVNASGDFNFTNVTVNDIYPPQTESFISSEPPPDAGTNNTWSIGNIANGTTFTINISVNISLQANGTVINNSANITWNDTAGITYIFPVRENTTLLAPVDTNLTVTKTNPSGIFPGSTFTYTITVSVNNEAAFNVTVSDILPPSSNVTFVSSVPANVSNLTWNLGGISAGSSSVILLTVQVNESVQQGTMLNNTVNVTYQNITGGNKTASALNINFVGSRPMQGGGSPGVGRWVVYDEVPEPQYPQVSEEQMEFDSMIDAPMPAWPLLDANIETNSVACGYVTRGGEVVIRGSADTVPVPPGFEIIAEPLEFSCAGDALDFTLNVPDNFEEVKVLRCKGGSCAEMPREIFTDELVCANKTLQVLRREEVLSRSKGLEKPRAFASKAKELSPVDRSIVGGSIRLTLTGELQSAVRVQVSGAENVPRPQNPTLSLLGTPHQVSIDGNQAVLPANLEWSFIVPDRYDITNFAVYALKGDEWVYLGAQYNTAAKLVTVQIPNMKELLVDNKVTFVMVGLADPGSWVESEPHLTQEYDGNGGRDAIILVHGFGAAATWRPFVDDFQLTNQPYQVWLYSYPASRPNEDNAKALASFLELHSSEYDNVYLVSHSLGALVTREALESARTQGLPVLGKVRRLVLVAGPGAGTPTVQVFRELFTKFLAEKTALGMLNMHPRVYDELRQGISLDPMHGVEYDVIAGNVGYWFTEALFGDTNDGVVALRSAQTVGSQVLNNQCADSFELSVSHVDLNDHPAARRVAQRLITGQMAEANPDLALPGFNQFVRLQVDDCSQEDRVFVLGRRVSPLAAADASGCSCGNGVCGVDETRESCPNDCVQEVVSSTGCILLPIPMMIVLLALVAVTGVALVRKHVSKKRIASWMWIVIIVLAGVSVVMQGYHASSCLPKFPAVYLGLVSVLVLLAIDWFIGLVPKKSVPKKQDINSEIDDIADAIQKIKK